MVKFTIWYVIILKSKLGTSENFPYSSVSYLRICGHAISKAPYSKIYPNSSQGLKSRSKTSVQAYLCSWGGWARASKWAATALHSTAAESSTLSSFSLFLCEPLWAGSAVHLSLARRECGAWWAVQCLGALSPMRAQGTPLLVYCCLLLAGHTVFTAQCSAGRTNTTSSYSSCYAHWNKMNNLCMKIKVSLTFFQGTWTK